MIIDSHQDINNARISVIVPVYKVESYLRQCVDSIINQTYKNLEILLVDDGSPDNCPQICDEYASNDQRIKVIHKHNGGQSEARNKALDIATGDYISFVDSDDWLAPNMYETLMSKISEKTCDIGMCARYVVTGKKITVDSALSEDMIKTKEEVMPIILKDIIGSQPWDKIYKKELWDGIRFPVGRVYEDIATLYLVFEKCHHFCYINTPLYYYRLNNVGTSFSERPNKIFDTFCSFRERLEFAENNYPMVSDKCLALAFGVAMGTINYHLRFNFKEEEKNLPVIDQFIRDYSDRILSSNLITIPRKILLRLYMGCKPLYNAIMLLAIKYKYWK